MKQMMEGGKKEKKEKHTGRGQEKDPAKSRGKLIWEGESYPCGHQIGLRLIQGKVHLFLVSQDVLRLKTPKQIAVMHDETM